MLNGIGGSTVAEAQARMSYREFMQWVAFRRKRGTLHTGMRLDNGFALLASMYANAHSKEGGYKLQDFAPYHEEAGISLDDAMRTWH